jgi:hypothetical protein
MVIPTREELKGGSAFEKNCVHEFDGFDAELEDE